MLSADQIEGLQHLGGEGDLNDESKGAEHNKKRFSAPRSSHLTWEDVSHAGCYGFQTCKLKKKKHSESNRINNTIRSNVEDVMSCRLL